MRNNLAPALLVWAVAACASQGSEAAERRADTAGIRDSVAGVAAASMNESNVIGLLDLTHAADSALGALGATKGTSSEVKEFGRMILREHHALRRDLLAMGEQLGMLPQPPAVAPDEPPTVMRDSLTLSEAGVRWDRAYIDYAMALHQSAMENMARALAATKRAEIKEFIDKSVPILQKHLDKARSLRRQLPKPQDTSSTTTRTPSTKR
jgi:putative membrane protein